MGKKHFLIFLLMAFIIGVFAPTFCLAAAQHSCCKPQKSECSMDSMKSRDAASPEAKTVKPSPAKSVNKKAHDHQTQTPVQTFVSDSFFLPDFHLVIKLSHPAIAPPLA